MIRSKPLMIAALMLTASMAGCSATLPPKKASVADTNVVVRTVPVFVVPSCQVLAGEQQCVWFEPRGFQTQPRGTAPASTSQPHVNGIAL
ncbi:hypothetical protein F2S72_09305 [Pseudomonas syringae pv. actinidiae]|nr:hypothetical protein [Pseudomonas syringae pv. actinidiae]